MTFAMSKELQFLAGHRFHVKLTPMSNVPYRVVYLYQFYMRLRSIRVAAIHELPLQCVFLHQSYKAHLQTEMVLHENCCK